MNRLFIKNIIFCSLISVSISTICMDDDKPEWRLCQSLTLDKPINAVAFNTKDTFLALAEGRTRALIYDKSDWQEIKTLTQPQKNAIDSLYFTPQDELLSGGIFLHTACLANLDKQKEIASIDGGENDWVSASRIASGGSLLAIGYQNKVDLYDLNEKNKKMASFDVTIPELKEFNMVTSLDINSTSQLLAASCLMGKFFIFNIETQQLIFSESKKDCDFIVTLSESGDFFVAGDTNGIVDVYKIDKEKNVLKKIHCFENHEEKTIRSLSVSPNDKLLAVGTEDCLYIHNLTDENYFFSFPNTGLIKALAFSHCSTLLAAGSLDKVARIFTYRKMTCSSTKN